MGILELMKERRIYFDGGMGSLLQARGLKPGELPETWNLSRPEIITEIHREYLDAGSDVVTTNTFGANHFKFKAEDGYSVKEIVTAAVRNAKNAIAAAGHGYAALDMGPTGKLLKPYGDLEFEDAYEAYKEVVLIGKAAGADLVIIETMGDGYELKAAVLAAKENSDLPVFATVTLDEKGKMLTGGNVESVTALLEGLGADVIGLNCGLGPIQLLPFMRDMAKVSSTPILVNPNAGLPRSEGGKTVYDIDADEFATAMQEMARNGATVLGGCCGTTPEFIGELSSWDGILNKIVLDTETDNGEQTGHVQRHGFLYDENGERKQKKLIAVELAPPFNADDEKLLESAHLLKNAGVDVLTFPDSPSGRTRVDSVLMASKVRQATGLSVMPHICCRDRNAIAMRSLFLGAAINDIHNFLIITGDPIPSTARQTVKAVFNSDSTGLMKIAKEMNEDVFAKNPLCYGGAINQGRKNLDVEIGRVKKKMEEGAEFFLTQPVFTEEDAARLRRIKEETGAKILCGIMPLISRKNAMS